MGLDVTAASGLSHAQRDVLLALGAHDTPKPEPA